MELVNINSATGPPTRKLAAVSSVGHLDEEPETSPESNLLIGAIVNTEFLAALNRLEIPRLLENKWAKILHRVLTEYYQTYKKAPGATVTELIGCLKSDLDATDYGLILHTIKAAQKRFIEGGAEFDFRFNLDSAEKYLQSRAIVLHREEEKLLLKAGKVEEAGKLLEDFKLPSLAVDEKNSLKNALADPGLVMTFREFRELDHPPKEYLLIGSFPLEKSSITIISGDTGAGKTFFQMELARIMAGAEYGLAGLIHADVPRKVCYIDGELPEGELVDRIDALEFVNGNRKMPPRDNRKLTPLCHKV